MSELHLKLQLQRSNGFNLDLDTVIPPRTCTAVYGASGSGKTTLLNCVAGLQHPAAGSTIRFGANTWLDHNTEVATHQRQVGYVFQDARLFPWLSVSDNLDYALRRRHRSDGPSREQVCDWLQLQELLPQEPAQLSRGQQQRVAIARALLSAPQILLLDEPLANIDQVNRRQILGHLQTVQRETGLPMLFVSHDIEEVTRLADWLVVLEGGRIRAQGPTLDLCSQLDLALAHEEQAAAILEAEVGERDAEFGLTRLSFAGQSLWVTGVSAATGARMRLRIPARDVSLCLQPPQQTSILNVLQARVTAIEDSQSDRLLVQLEAAGQLLLARLTRKSVVNLNLQTGQLVYAQIKSVALLSDEPH
ncbi:molybdenum ABC transporter ATP-binding protein [Halieaceae bacterium IMCC14734]|uniref:Molybdenum ABC transporter ATP-binding protein n=1 Tax=Candidatus Litorirhabdus singularis TaxID=2518993 RepID=A0ABT3TBV8_9GAMM|nr:molybdenum ABC transporter ATP-binding protein [Candidatus Litorirhabdus singularis]MCX2979764.1 molybdenum ABC transporter ATP-binding protein [Candidatus Litorirhabdus singularis]